jgi:hypothetical protein
MICGQKSVCFRKYYPPEFEVTKVGKQKAMRWESAGFSYLCVMIRPALLLLLFQGWMMVRVSGQAAVNPFDLIHRLPKEVLAAAGSGELIPATNPFDVVAHRTPAATQVLSENKTEAFRPFSILPRGNGLSGTLLFGLLVAMFAVLTLSVAANRSAVGKAWRGFLNDNALTQAQREATGIVGSTPYYLLYLNFLLNIGLFIFLVIRFFTQDRFNNAAFLFICLIGGAGIFLSKHVMFSVMRYLFPLETEINRYNFLIIIFNCILGLFLVPFNFMIAFGSESFYQGLLVFWVLGLVSIFYIYRSLRALNIGSKFLVSDQFHFLLYLCTVEVAPVVLLAKLAIMQF